MEKRSSKLKRIGLFGGTFDPVHLGHIIAAQEALHRLKLNTIIFMPSSIPPHKNRKNLTPARERLHMVSLAIGGNPRFYLSDMEIRRGGRSYSIETVEQLRKMFGKHARIYFITGADSIIELPTWKNVKKLIRLCQFVFLTRPGFSISFDTVKDFFSAKERASLERGILRIPLIDISSTDIRRRVAAGKPIRYMVPDAVERYIRRRRLYVK